MLLRLFLQYVFVFWGAYTTWKLLHLTIYMIQIEQREKILKFDFLYHASITNSNAKFCGQDDISGFVSILKHFAVQEKTLNIYISPTFLFIPIFLRILQQI